MSGDICNSHLNLFSCGFDDVKQREYGYVNENNLGVDTSMDIDGKILAGMNYLGNCVKLVTKIILNYNLVHVLLCLDSNAL